MGLCSKHKELGKALLVPFVTKRGVHQKEQNFRATALVLQLSPWAQE